MKILDKLISKIAVLFLIIVASIFILLPFDGIKILSLNNITRVINTTRGNYLYSIGGVIIFILSIKSLFSGITKGSNRQNHIVTPMNFGRIAAQTARNIVIQKIKDAERDIIYNEFITREKELSINKEVKDFLDKRLKNKLINIYT